MKYVYIFFCLTLLSGCKSTTEIQLECQQIWGNYGFESNLCHLPKNICELQWWIPQWEVDTKGNIWCKF